MDDNETIRQNVLHKEIDLIQSCITRMAKNSFLLKGWLISLIVVLIALLKGNTKINVICLVFIIPVICFWYLDGYFIRLEKLFRKKYEWIISERLNGNNNYLYDLNPYNENMWIDPINVKKKITLFRCIFSESLIPFYGVTLIVIILMYKFLIK